MSSDPITTQPAPGSPAGPGRPRRVPVALIYDGVFPYEVGGVEHRNYVLAQLLSRSYRVSLYGFGYWADDPSYCLPGCEYVSVGPPVPRYDGSGRRRVSQAVRFAAGLFGALFRGREELWDIANFPYFSVPVARLLSLLRGRKLVVTWHEYWGDYWYAYFGWRGFVGKLVERVALWCSPRVITVSEHTRRRLLAAGYPAGKITVVPNGVDVDRITGIPPATEASDLVYAGRLVPHKQVDLILRAVSLLHRTDPGVTLCVIGDGPEGGRLAALARELGVGDRVTFTGRLPREEDVFARFKASRVLLLPSKREGFGMTAVQAWACGIPAVVCDEPLSALPELIDDPVKGRVVPSTPEAVAAACRELLGRPAADARPRLREAARGFGWDGVAARLVSVYEGVLRGGGAVNYLYSVYRATERENCRVIETLLERQPSARLLDLGCYDGELTLRLAGRVGTSRLTGVEVVEEKAALSRAKGIEVVAADLNRPLPFPDGSFDVIHANQVIEHLYDTDCFAGEVSRLLSPQGYAIISTNNLASLHNIVSLMLGQQPPPAHVSNRVIVGNAVNPLEGTATESAAMTHLRIFSYKALRDFLRHYGLRCEVYRTVGFYPFPVGLARLLCQVFPIYGAFLTCKVRRI